MGMAEIAVALWKNLKHNPSNPRWFNRDRFVLSNGHGSMLLYSLLHLSGYSISIDDLKDFRKLKSKTPGHPEYDIDNGIETTTGPLGQGIANAVGMAIAEKSLSAQFNTNDISPIDHFTYAFVGDGCLMEGISHEACSFAGTHELGKLICFYDQNGISIDGEIDNWFTDNTVERFNSYGWQTISGDGGSVTMSGSALVNAPSERFLRTTTGSSSSWVPSYLALWDDAALLLFESSTAFDNWTVLKGSDKTLGRANGCIDMETIVGIREVESDGQTRCLEMETFDGRRVYIRLSDGNQFSAWLDKLRSIVRDNTNKMRKYLQKTNGDASILSRDVSEIQG